MSAFFAMGGYAAFVWPAYGLTIVALAATIGIVWRRYARAKAKLAAAQNA